MMWLLTRLSVCWYSAVFIDQWFFNIQYLLNLLSFKYYNAHWYFLPVSTLTNSVFLKQQQVLSITINLIVKKINNIKKNNNNIYILLNTKYVFKE